jgi:hypothetical protein
MGTSHRAGGLTSCPSGRLKNRTVADRQSDHRVASRDGEAVERRKGPSATSARESSQGPGTHGLASLSGPRARSRPESEHNPAKPYQAVRFVPSAPAGIACASASPVACAAGSRAPTVARRRAGWCLARPAASAARRADRRSESVRGRAIRSAESATWPAQGWRRARPPRWRMPQSISWPSRSPALRQPGGVGLD